MNITEYLDEPVTTSIVEVKLTSAAEHLLKEVAAGRNRIFYHSEKPNGWAQLVKQKLATSPGNSPKDRASLTKTGMSYYAEMKGKAAVKEAAKEKELAGAYARQVQAMLAEDTILGQAQGRVSAPASAPARDLTEAAPNAEMKKAARVLLRVAGEIDKIVKRPKPRDDSKPLGHGMASSIGNRNFADAMRAAAKSGAAADYRKVVRLRMDASPEVRKIGEPAVKAALAAHKALAEDDLMGFTAPFVARERRQDAAALVEDQILSQAKAR